MISPEQKANRLIHEQSPYLLQHAYNPVDWYAWGDEAFQRAAAEDKPVLLSIGYATCHWCHVMERESFEDALTAELLNREFIAIKLDREERPDVDQIYMRALHATGQHGGWPLNMFLTPDRRPITGGTYFPPRPSFGRPSFQQVLTQVASVWREDRKRALDSAQLLHEFLTQPQSRQPAADAARPELLLAQAGRALASTFDGVHGGFLSNGPNKFPPSMALLLLLDLNEQGQSPEALQMVEKTLSAMKCGGIYDQVGGGISRYSTDHQWLVPHFEKMLYDNALFARALCECYRQTGRETYRQWALDIFEYLRRDLTAPEGAFYSAEDADSEGEEGKFYVWSLAEFRDALAAGGLSKQEQDRMQLYWGLEAGGNFEGQSILHAPHDDEAFSLQNNCTIAEFKELRRRARQALLATRNRRPRPLRDEKILLNWNALMISALARAAQVFDDGELARRACVAADWLIQSLRKADGAYLRRSCQGEARFAAQLSDLSLFANALIDLYRTEFRSEYLLEARRIAELICDRFESGDGLYFESEAGASDLIARIQESYDGVEPSGNAACVELFSNLARYGFGMQWQERATEALKRLSESIAASPAAHCYALHTLYLQQRPLQEIALCTATDWREDAETGALLGNLRRRLGPDSIVAVASDHEPTRPALLADRLAGSAGRRYFFCQDFRCQLPVDGSAALLAQIDSARAGTREAADDQDL
ncbi:MAG: thioredoxin domain-containing protein [Leptospirales bacterium]|nr:thioredoxin domain-containing protein [Leptospirales bacterium]